MTKPDSDSHRQATSSVPDRVPPQGLRRQYSGCVLLVVTAYACGGGRAKDTGTDSAPTTVAECQEYDRIFSSCMGRNAGAAKAARDAKTDEERARLRDLCAINTTRLQTTCR